MRRIEKSFPFHSECERGDKYSLSSQIIDNLEERERPLTLTRDSTLKSSKNSLEVRPDEPELEESDSANNEDSGFTSIKVNN